MRIEAVIRNPGLWNILSTHRRGRRTSPELLQHQLRPLLVSLRHHDAPRENRLPKTIPQLPPSLRLNLGPYSAFRKLLFQHLYVHAVIDRNEIFTHFRWRWLTWSLRPIFTQRPRVQFTHRVVYEA